MKFKISVDGSSDEIGDLMARFAMGAMQSKAPVVEELAAPVQSALPPIADIPKYNPQDSGEHRTRLVEIPQHSKTTPREGLIKQRASYAGRIETVEPEQLSQVVAKYPKEWASLTRADAMNKLSAKVTAIRRIIPRVVDEEDLQVLYAGARVLLKRGRDNNGQHS